MRGRPLWFAGLLITAWTAARVALLWPESAAATGPAETVRDAPMPQGVATAATPAILPAVPNFMAARLHAVPQLGVASTDRRHSAVLPHRNHLSGVVASRFAAAAPDQQTIPKPADASGSKLLAPGLPQLIPPASRSRWSGSAWAIARDGGAAALLSPLLGGSQAGVRIAYALDRTGRTAVFGRLASPLGRGKAEVALGGQWRPGRLPVTAFAEARASDGRVAPAVGLFGGGAIAFGRFRLDGYGQAGVIARDGATGFGDGQIRFARTIGRVEAGAGLWGAAQRGAARLDVGPSLSLPIPVDPFALRLTLDWRHRVAGNARPASGPVLSLGADF